jgi:hypothetical protein
MTAFLTMGNTPKCGFNGFDTEKEYFSGLNIS